MIGINKINETSTKFKNNEKSLKRRIIICAGTACVANGSLKVRDAFVNEIKIKSALNVSIELKIDCECGSDVYISKSGCQGFCQMGPLVTILPDNILYTKVKAKDVEEIVDNTILNGRIIDRLLYNDPLTHKICKNTEEINFYKKQKRYVLELCGKIDPEDINEYIANGGYLASAQIYSSKKPFEIIEEMKKSGLRGRGGGGFSTGLKWEFAALEKNEKKYVICNGDEGDPGAFMDRSIMEGNPHSVIEGMLIAARAIGADEGYVYVRTEYQLAVERMKKAVKSAELLGILGKNIFGFSLNFKLNVMEGVGAFVCGEETALIASIEGKRGMPDPKPPFPAQSGLHQKPTIINNVETLATVPLIFRDGWENFRKVGSKNSPGTKTFAITGNVANTGLIEVPFGSTLREIIFEIAGGVTNSKNEIENGCFKAVQIGGPSGGCLTKEHLDLPLDFDSVKTVGAMVGSGGLVVMNNNTCMIQISKFFMQFTQNESCGKCVLCREGTKQMLALLNDITKGKATNETIDLLKELGNAISKGSLCGLGKSAPNPVLSTLRYFYDEYKNHIDNKKCSTGQCSDLVEIEIVKEKCKGCTLCSRKCPAGAITGKVKEPHYINKNICIKCGVCIDICKFGAIVKK